MDALKETSCDTCADLRSSLCNSCGSEGSSILSRSRRRRHFAAKGHISWPGDKAREIATVTKGLAASVRSMHVGRAQILALHFIGDTIGRADQLETSLEVIALTDLELCVIDAAAFSRALGADPKLREHFLHQSMEELDRTRAWMTNLGRKGAIERVASLILSIASRSGHSDTHGPERLCFELPMTREEMAGFMGTATETVSRAISDLKKTGAIRCDGRFLTVVDPEMLLQISGDCPEAD